MPELPELEYNKVSEGVRYRRDREKEIRRLLDKSN